MKVAFGANALNNMIDVVADISWGGLIERLKTYRKARVLSSEYWAMSKNDRQTAKLGSWFIPADFSTPIRREAYMNRSYAFVGDLDIGNLSTEDLRHFVGKYEFFAYESFSSRPDDKRWRIILPYAVPIDAKLTPQVYKAMSELIGTALAPESGKICQLWYEPACCLDANPSYLHNKGVFLDYSHLELPQTPEKSVETPVVSDFEQLSAALNAISIGKWPAGQRYVDRWEVVCAAVCHETGASEKGFELFHSWCQRLDNVEGYTGEQEIRRQFFSFGGSHPNPVTIGSLVMLAKQQNPGFRLPPPTPPAVQDPSDYSGSMAWMNARFAYVAEQDKVWRFENQNFTSWHSLREQLAGMEVETGERNRDGMPKMAPLAIVWQRSQERRDNNRPRITYKPGQPALTEKNEINVWAGFATSPVPGDIAPWGELLQHCFTESDGSVNLGAYKWFEQWCAYPIQHPGTKLYTASIFWSRQQGTGKSFTGEILKRIYGDNARTVNANELHADFNGWAAKRQFILGEENTSDHPRADSQKLKAKITQTSCNVNEKHQPVYVIDDSINYFFTSNRPNAFAIELSDRRYFVWHVNEAKLPQVLVDKLNVWLDNGGAEHLHEYLLNQVGTSDFVPTAEAFHTDAKAQMQETTLGPLQEWLRDYVERGVGRDPNTPGITSSSQLAKEFQLSGGKPVTGNAVTRALDELGLLSLRVAFVHGRTRRLVAATDPKKWDMTPVADWVTEAAKNDQYRI